MNEKVIINLGTPCWIVSGYTRRHRLVLSSFVTELTLCLLGLGVCNTPGVCHQLSNGFEFEHDMLSGDEGVKIKSTRVSSNLNLDNTPLLTCVPLLRLCKSNVKHAYSMYITSPCIHLDPWKSFMKFGIKKSHEMISHIFA